MLKTTRWQSNTLMRLVWQDRLLIAWSAVTILAIIGMLLIFLGSAAIQNWDISWGVANQFNVSRDGSIAEKFNHGMAFFAAMMFCLALIEQRRGAYFLLAILMFFIWFDDSTSYHENFGARLVEIFDLPGIAGLRPQDSGEFLAWALAFVALFLIWLACQTRSRLGDGGIFLCVLVPFSMLVFFGFVVDFAHILAPEQLDILIGTIEDGGEMFAVALIAMFALACQRHGAAYAKICETSDVANA